VQGPKAKINVTGARAIGNPLLALASASTSALDAACNYTGINAKAAKAAKAYKTVFPYLEAYLEALPAMYPVT
jgi:hypothetical protein